METDHKHTDYTLGQRICNELRSGNRSAILELYDKYHRFFTAFARRRLFDKDPHRLEDVLSNFWVELLNRKAICKYRGKASLQTYLTVILNRRIIDANRKFGRNRQLNPVTEDLSKEIECRIDESRTPEQEIIIKEQQELIQEALVRLADISPRDANLIQMNLEGLNYEQMAKKELNDQRTDPAELKRKAEAIKKQFTRSNSGSMAKFRRMLNKCMDTQDLEYRDLLN